MATFLPISSIDFSFVLFSSIKTPILLLLCKYGIISFPDIFL